MDLVTLESASLPELLGTYSAVIDEFVRRGISRTRDAPTGQLAEALVARALGAKLAANSMKSWDCVRSDGKTVQVKSRVLGRDKPGLIRYRQLSPFRSWDFDFAVVVLFAADYSIHRATELPVDVVRAAQLEKNAHVNGWIVHARDALLNQGRDLTDLMNKTLADWPAGDGAVW